MNYASFGIDSRIGLGFDFKRTSSRCCNKLMYGWEGMKKICCIGGGAKMQQLIAKMEVVVDANQNPEVNLISSYKFNQGENLHKKP